MLCFSPEHVNICRLSSAGCLYLSGEGEGYRGQAETGHQRLEHADLPVLQLQNQGRTSAQRYKNSLNFILQWLKYKLQQLAKDLGIDSVSVVYGGEKPENLGKTHMSDLVTKYQLMW